MALTPADRQQILETYRTNANDTGGSEVQIAILTHDIRALTEHLKKHTKDYHTQRGLMLKVGRRNRLLRYLKRQKPRSYLELIEKLGLRK